MPSSINDIQGESRIELGPKELEKLLKVLYHVFPISEIWHNNGSVVVRFLLVFAFFSSFFLLSSGVPSIE